MSDGKVFQSVGAATEKDLANYYGFVVDEFYKLVRHTLKSQWSLSDCRSRSQIDLMPAS